MDFSILKVQEVVKVKIAFRADSSEYIGVGHIMRCLSLAHELIEQGHDVYFYSFLLKDFLANKITDTGAKLVHLEDKSMELLAEQIKCHQPEVFIFDIYDIPLESVRELKASFPAIYMGCIEDYFKPNALDFVINQNVYAKGSDYKKFNILDIFAGPNYALLRREFRQVKSNQSKLAGEEIKVLITCGGFDPYKLSETFLDFFEKLNGEALRHELSLRFIVNSAKLGLDEFKTRIHSLDFKAEVVENVDDMACQMSWADLAISGGGTTVLELLKLNIPALLILIAENQRLIVEHMHNQNLSINLGEKERLNYDLFKKQWVYLIDNYDSFKLNMENFEVGNLSASKHLMVKAKEYYEKYKSGKLHNW